MVDNLFDRIAEEMTAVERKVAELEEAVSNLQDINHELTRDAQLHINDLVAQAMDAQARSARWKRCAKRLRRQNLNQARRMAYVLLIGALCWAGAIGMAVYIFRAGRVGL